jgi:Family of unknown function (DUF6545)
VCGSGAAPPDSAQARPYSVCTRVWISVRGVIPSPYNLWSLTSWNIDNPPSYSVVRACPWVHVILKAASVSPQLAVCVLATLTARPGPAGGPAGSSTIAIGYSISKAIAITASWAGISMRSLNTTIAPAFASLGAAIMLIGFLCPSLIPQINEAVKRTWALYRLRPLWSDLGDALPDITRTTPTMRRSIRARLYRRVIEIRDALLILQPHLCPETTTRAEQLATTLRITSSKRDAAIEAARIAAALHAHRNGSATTDRGEIFGQPDQLSFTGEVRWLAAVATAYRTSPLVPSLLCELGDKATTNV